MELAKLEQFEPKVSASPQRKSSVPMDLVGGGKFSQGREENQGLARCSDGSRNEPARAPPGRRTRSEQLHARLHERTLDTGGRASGSRAVRPCGPLRRAGCDSLCRARARLLITLLARIRVPRRRPSLPTALSPPKWLSGQPTILRTCNRRRRTRPRTRARVPTGRPSTSPPRPRCRSPLPCATTAPGVPRETGSFRRRVIRRIRCSRTAAG